MKGRFFAFTRALFGLGLFLLITTSCEIGLGAAVDTEAPYASIVSPSVKDAVSGDIVVTGTSTDDVKMDHMEIFSMANSVTGAKVDLLTGKAIPTSYENGVWQWTFTLKHESGRIYSYDGETFELKDGTYTLQMKACDQSGSYSSAVSRTFDVDNTPPVFLLKKPNSLRMDEATAFGQSVSIKGSVADDHNIESMKVRLYRDNNGEKEEVQLTKNVFTGFDVSDTNVEIAVYAGDDNEPDTREEQNYADAYDLTEEGTQFFYLDIEIKDIAGNVTRNVFIEENIGAALTAKGITGIVPTGAEIKQVLNDSYFDGSVVENSEQTTRLTEDQCAIVKRIFSESDDQENATLNANCSYLVNESSPLALKINVRSNPTYVINNTVLKLNDDDEEVVTAESWEKVSQNAKLSFIVQQGADANGIDPSTITAKIYKAPEASLSQEALDAVDVDENLVWNSEDDENWKKLYYLEAADDNYLKNRTNPVANASYILELPDLEQGSYYIVKLAGEDVKGVSLIPSSSSSSYFGFLASGNGNAPALDATNGQIVKYVSGSPFDFALTINDSLGDKAHYKDAAGLQVGYELYLGKAASLDKVSELTRVAAGSGTLSGKPEGSSVFVLDSGSDVDNGSYVYKVKIPNAGTAAGENYTYVLTVKSKNGGGESNKERYLFYVDGKAPDLQISGNEFTDNACIKEDKAPYNANASVPGNEYQLSGTWADTGSGIKRLYYTVNGGTEEHEITNLATAVADSTGWNVNIPVTDDHGSTYTFVAQDAVGNETRVTRSNIRFDLSDPEITITRTPSTGADDITNVARTYTVEAEDAYGMDSLEITATKTNGSQLSPSSITPVDLSDPKKKRSTIVFDPSSSEGIWTVNIIAKDSNNRTVPKTFSLTVDGTAPEIQDTFTVDNDTNTYTATGTSNFFAESSLNITGLVAEETSGISKIYWERKRSTDPAITSIDSLTKIVDVSGTSSGSNYAPFSFNVSGLGDTVGSAYNVIYLAAEDAAGNKGSIKKYYIWVDSTNPTIRALGYTTGTGYNSISETVYHKGGNLTLYGSVSESGTGVDRLVFDGITPTEVKFSTSELSESNYNSDIWNASTATDGTSIKSWKAVFAPTGSENITVTAYDKAERASSPLNVCQLQLDTTPPTVNSLNITDGQKIFETMDILEERAGKWYLTVNGKWSDEGSGTNELKYRIYKNGSWSDYVPVTAPKQKLPVGWSFEVEVNEGSGQKIQITANDVAGNSLATPIEREFVIDCGKPTVLPPTYQDVYKKSDIDALTEKTLVLAFNASDTHNLESTSITVERVGDASYTGTTPAAGLEINNNVTLGTTQTASVKLTSPAADGKWIITATAKDKAGRSSDPCTITVTLDGVEPTIANALTLSYMENDALVQKTWSQDAYYGKTAMTFAGTASESIALKTVYYKLVSGTDSTEVPNKNSFKSGASSIPVSGTGTVAFSATSTEFKTDAATYNKLYIQAEDAAGNLSDVQTFDVHVDMTAPDLEVSHFANGSALPTAYSGNILTNKGDSLTIYGKADDSVSGLDRIKFFAGSTDITNKVELKYAASSITASDLNTSSVWVDLTDSNCKTVGWWKAVFARNDIPNGSIAVRAYDKAGNESTASFAIVVDSQEPTLHNVKLTGNGSYSKESGTYYITNDTSVSGVTGSFEISGMTNDDYKIGRTTYKLKLGDVEKADGVTLDASATWSFTIDLSNTAVWTNGTVGVIEITAYDAAGNSYTQNCNVEIDTEKPGLLSNEFKVNYKYKGEDVYKDQVFFVGGGKYSESSFARNTSLPVSGYYSERGSGIKEIYYLVKSVNATDAATMTSAQIIAGKSGTFAVSGTGTTYPEYKGSETRKYKLNADDTPVMVGGVIDTEHFPESKYFSFNETLAGFVATSSSQKDVLYLVAVDNCGNVSEPKKVFVNVDVDPGNITSDATGEIPTDGVTSFTITGYAEDSLSGIEIVDFKVVGENGSEYPILGYDASAALNAENYATAHSTVLEHLNTNGYAARGIVRYYAHDGSDNPDSYKTEYEKVDFYRNDDGSWQTPSSGEHPSFFLADGPHKIKWELTVTPKSSWFTTANLGSSPKIMAVVKDWAGNPNPPVYYPVATLKLDTVPPVATITSPSTTEAVNGTLSIEGKVTDVGSAPRTIVLYTYTGTDDTVPTANVANGWVPFKGLTTKSGTVQDETNTITLDSNVNVSSIYSFKIDGYDFNADLGTRKTGKVFILPVAYDEAGNANVKLNEIKTTDYVSFNVNLDSDRPEISLNEITGNGVLESERYISKFRTNIGGIIRDDDKIEEIKIASTPITTASDWNTYNQTGTLSYTPGTSTVTFDYEPPVDGDTSDGNKTLYIYVKDSEGGEFWTSKAPVWTQPRVKYAKSSAYTDLNTVITYLCDSTPPDAHVYVGMGSTDNIAKNAALGSATQASGIVKAGGNSSIVYVRVDASDYNGIKSVTGTLDGVETPLAFAEETTNSGKYLAKIAGSAYSGQKTLAITVTDNCDFESHPQVNFVFDNTGPEIKMTTRSDIAFIGEVIARGTTSDAIGSEVVDLNCLLLNSDYYTGTTLNETKLRNWFINPANAKTVESFFNWEFELDMPAGSESALTKYRMFENLDGTYDMQLALYAKDVLGNETIVVKTIKYNPDADRPTVQIVYPDVKENASSADVSGTIRVSGTAMDNDSVDSVYLQVAFGHKEKKTPEGITTMWESKSDADDGLWNSSALSGLGSSYEIVRASDLGLSDDAGDPNFWGIKVTAAESWYITLNKSREFQNTVSCDDNTAQEKDKTYTIWIRAAAVDDKKIRSKWSEPVALSLNPNAPSIGDSVTAVVDIYNNAAYDTKIKTVKYTSDMWINGYAKLVTSAEHANGISELSYKIGDDVTTVIGEGATHASLATELNGVNGYKIEIPLNTGSGAGVCQVNLTATEGGNGLTKTETYTINYDTTPPTIGAFTLNDGAFGANAKLQNSNLRLTLGGNVEDEASGFERLLFYFIRDTDAEHLRVYDPQFDYTKNSTGSVIDVSTDTSVSSLTTYGSSLYGSELSVTIENQTQLTMPAADIHVRDGGIVIIDGVWYRIRGVSGTSVTLDESIPVDSTPVQKTVFFPYAQVVDNTSSETIKTWTTGSHTFRGSEDGDNMPESISKLGSVWTWDATLHGNYIPDGPVEFVVFAQDKAGNISSDSIRGTLQNNPPRLAKVYLGTDLNHDDKYSDFEFETYDIYGVEESYQEAYALTTAEFKVMVGNEAKSSTRPAFIAKNKLAVYPQFVGGMDPIKVVFTKTTADGALEAVPGSGAALQEADTTLKHSNNTIITDGIYEFTNSQLTGGSNVDDVTAPVLLTFWDSTDGLTCGDDSQYSVLKISDLKLDLVDEKDPTNAITPFYWNSAEDNSLYGESTANGHIELEGDWKVAGTEYSSSATSGVEDGDPKVSGKIKIEGYAYDETMLGSISVKFDTFGFPGNLGDDGDYKKLASYSSGVWTLPTSASMDTSGWSFELKDAQDETQDETQDENVYFGQKGHKVKWILNLDTSKINGYAKHDVNVYVMARDAAGRITSTDYNSVEGDGTYNKTVYKVDVVPYITSVKTSLSEKTSNPDSSEYDRTARGHYPVRMMKGSTVSESIAISGFNLGSNSSLTVDHSGPVSITVAGCESINNMNNNDAHGSYSGGDDDLLKGYMEDMETIPPSGDYDLYSNFYNRLPNNMNNNTLTDDVYFDVWSINTEAAVGESGRGTLQELVMKINQNSKQIGFAFANGSTRFSMPNGNTNSNELWYGDYDTFAGVSLAFDSVGNSYGTASGGDIASEGNSTSTGIYTFFTSRWRHPTPSNINGGDYKNTSREALNANAIDEIGQRGYKTNPNNDYNVDKRRFKSPSMAVNSYNTIDGHVQANVYLAYYDSINKEVRFKWDLINSDFDESKATATLTGPSGKYTYDPPARAGSRQNTGYLAHIQNRNLSNDNAADKYRNDYVQVIAETLTSGTSEVTLGKAGEYVGLDVIPGSDGKDTVVLVWYDGADTWFTYSNNINDTNPTNMKGNSTTSVSTAYTTSVGDIDDWWTKPVRIFEGAGAFCKVVADKNGGVHIAAQDPSNGDLRYAYISTLPAYVKDQVPNITPQTCVVDSYGIIGSQLTIDVGVDGTGSSAKTIPYISYYAGSLPKMAYLPEGVDSLEAGADEEDAFTGIWECGYVPTDSNISEDRINIGLWKNNGEITSSLTSGGVGASSCNTTDNTAVCYGNGTKNPVVGYVRKENSAVYYVETAQKK